MVSTITFKHSTLGNKTALISNFNYAWKNINHVQPIEGKAIVSDNGINTVTQKGWNNPTMSMTLELPSKDDAWFTANSIMDWQDLNMYARDLKTSSSTGLKVYVIDEDQVFSSYASTSSGVSDIPVVIDGFSLRHIPGNNRVIDIRLIEDV